MAKGKRIEGPRAPLFFSTASAVVLVLLSSYSANSQTVNVSALEQCLALEAEALKLRCFEAIIASSETDTGEESPVVASSPEQVTQTTEDTAADMVKVEPVVSASATPTAEVATANVPTATAKEAIAPVIEDAEIDEDSDLSAAAEATPASEVLIGKEQLAPQVPQNDADGSLVHANVLEVSKGRNDVLFFSLDNGQVWRQIEARHFNYPKNSEFDVSINRGMMGEYRMRIGEKSQMVRIRRVK